MKRSILMLALASFSCVAGAAPSILPLDVRVTNPGLPVEVRNADPVRVSVVPGPTVQPFQRAVIIGVDAGALGDQYSFTVPSNKRLVIEFASFHLYMPTGQRPTYLWVAVDTADSNQSPVRHYFLPVYQATAPVAGEIADIFAASSPTRLYADPGTTVRLAFRRDSDVGTGLVNVSVSGYLEDVR